MRVKMRSTGVSRIASAGTLQPSCARMTFSATQRIVVLCSRHGARTRK